MRTTTVTTTVVIETDDDDLRGRVETLEEHMSELDDTLAADETQFAGYRADVDAKLAAMQSQIDTLIQQVADGDPAALATAKSLQTAIADARAAVGDANNDGDPAAPPVG
jgi:hypothetical protein